MSSQQSGARRQGRRGGRGSILQGVYEENLRTRRGQPAPRRTRKRVPRGALENAAPEKIPPRRAAPRVTATEAAAPPGKAAGKGKRVRWGGALMLAVFLLASGAAYVTGGTSLLQQRLLPSGAFSPGPPASAASAPVADSLQGRTAPFAPGAAGPGEEARSAALPARGGDAHSVAGLFGLEVKTIVIDPGHGGKKSGAVGPGGTREKHVALDVARRLQRRLEARYGYRILMTRTGDTHRSLRERVRFANRHQADLFLSIHVNALPDADVTSVETYYFGEEASPAARRLAERENQASGYSVAEFNRLLADVGQRLRREESKRLAGSIQESLYRNIKALNPEVRDWGVRTAPFVVLLGVEAPSILAEIGVISNPAEEENLRRPAYRRQLARFLEEGVARYLGHAPSSSSVAASDDTSASSAQAPRPSSALR